MLSKIKFPLNISIYQSIGKIYLDLHFRQINLIKLGPFLDKNELKNYLFTQIGLSQADINRLIVEQQLDKIISDKTNE